MVDDTRLWCLHHIGPDDVHPAPDFETAWKWAGWANERFADAADISRFTVSIWPWSAERHADGLAASIADWTLPSPSQDGESSTASIVGADVAWQPIESAPMNGETILAICASAYTPTAFDTWWADGWTHYSRPEDKWHGGVGKWFPTHWMPREAYLAALAASSNPASAGDETRAATIEQCAKIAENWNPGRKDRVTETGIAEAIRALDEGEGHE